MTSTIQTQPLGALGLLGAPTNVAPNKLLDTVQSVLELGPYWEMTLLAGENATFAGATNVGDATDLTVPNRTAWAVKAIGFIASDFTAPTTARFGINAIIGAGSTPIMPDLVATIAAAGDQASTGLVLSQPFLLPPGGEIVVILRNDLGAVTCQLNLRAIFARIPV